MPVSGTKTMWRIIRILAVFAIFGMTMVGIQLLAASPCDIPKTWSVGRVDPQFNLSKPMVAQYAKEATALWNTAHPQNPLLTYQENGGEIMLNFVYDERMQTTLRNQRLKRTINQGTQELSTIRDTLDSLKAQYASLGTTIDSLTATYTSHLNAYNKEVAYWNGQGGAPSTVYAQLEAKRQSVENERAALNTKIDTYNQLGDQIRTYGQDHNQIVTSLNQDINTLNQSAGQEFEEGVYDPNTNSVTVYEYDSPTSLKRVLAHEFGHALGLGHVDGENSIMYAINQGVTLKLSPEDLAALNATCKEKRLDGIFRATSDAVNAIRGDISRLVQLS